MHCSRNNLKHGGRAVRYAFLAPTQLRYPPWPGPLVTLTLDKALQADQFFHFYVTPGHPKGRFLHRRFLSQGKALGPIHLNIPPGPDEWLCPYFDSVTRTLRFRRRDGQDLETQLDLSQLSQSKVNRPLLLLAQREGLLDKVPGA